ncbi:heterogeneous nuclear ribonucleoprotein U isoform X2 [Linepithema humile]|uniref:heterogeneous nuclear ribonucleoprotein U isoform X2 n=1 Tax=Linepithema humile TaxID=83485 RepID=UPI000623B491|nr:PREDICTED: heterogeneous nuclear ribonucleoprotein U isoform X2 [Linepithema humile]
MDPAKLKVVELRAELSKRGLDSKGNKPVLVERLRKALEEENEQEYQESSVVHAENIDDTTLKETQEREATRSSQSPRTPSRASRSSSSSTSSVVSPIKISTRNASRTVTTPNSSKQFTSSKLQYVDKAYEIATISESTYDEPVVQQAKILKSPEKYREEQEDYASNIVQNKIYSSPLAESQQGQAKYINTLEDKYEANVPQVPATQPSEKSSTIAYVDQFSITPGEHETKGSNVREVDVDQHPIGEIQDLTKLKEKTEIKDVNIVQSTFEKNIEEKISVEKENVKYIEDTYNVKHNIDIPEAEQPTHAISRQVDKTCDIELKNEEKNIDKDYAVQNEQINVSMEDVDEKPDIPQDEQEVEMTEVKKDVKLDAEESSQKEYNDRKRKRSSSPVEVHQVSLAQDKAENEPDFDESAVILSWYDSDLNLIINKQGFLSAMPMHDNDFCHLWAGARASYGFINGKVYYEAKITEQHSNVAKDEKCSHILRVGWSVPHTSMQLGEETLSYTYTSTGQKGTDKKFTDYGSQFGKDDVVGCYLDMTPENTVELSYTVNGKDLGSAFSIPKEELGDRPLFPHILSKNCTFVCNFGQEKAWYERIPEYTLVGQIESKDRIAGPRRPENKADCEVIMICGLPAAGKTTWVRKHVAEHPDKSYNILALHNLVEKTGDVALSDKEQNSSRREVIIDKCNRALDQLIDVASVRRRNYILDGKSNVYSSAQRRKMRNFCGYQRKAVVVIPTDEEYKQRLSTHGAIEGSASESNIMEMKANFTAPSVGESFNAVKWIGLNEAEGKKLIEKYNKEGKEAGFSQQPTAKRPRLEKTESNRETRDSRNSRDNRRNNYQDRGRNSPWRGPNMGGWRGERPQRGGYMRHSGGYGPPAPWRARGGRGGPAMIRGPDRRQGNVDRRQGNDRNRSAVSRQGSWGPMSNYQGSQGSSNWSQQDNWSGSSQSQGSWSQQQGGWGQQQSWGGGWKGYGQSTYSQGYGNQQGYGNGNWSNWNQQYYNNQYWGQQQQSGQTTAAGSQAEITSDKVATTSANAGAGYNYSQG